MPPVSPPSPALDAACAPPAPPPFAPANWSPTEAVDGASVPPLDAVETWPPLARKKNRASSWPFFVVLAVLTLAALLLAIALV
jgi:hypothetical protein